MRYSINVASFWEDPAQGEHSIAAARAAFKGVEQFTHGFYANSMTDRSRADMQALYGDNLKRLQALKQRYDPRNLLRMNANVTPAG
jgi:FAD/FMN-containing dehydrogenase